MQMWRCSRSWALHQLPWKPENAGKAVDAYGSQPGFITQQNDGVQAYTQAFMQGIETWVELPIDRWPREWVGRYIRPVVMLRIALYGHPDSGGLWEQHCDPSCQTRKGGHPSSFIESLKLLLVVYVVMTLRCRDPKTICQRDGA